MTEHPVPASEIPHDVAQSLSGHGLLTRGAHTAHLQALRMHAESSVPINRGLAYTPDELMRYQARGRENRFLPGGVSDGLDLPLPLRRAPSFAPFDGPRAAAVDQERLRSVMRTLHDPDSRLYPSAGALYPVRLVAEQRGADGSGGELIALDPSSGRLVSRQALSGDGELGLDPTLAAVGTRFWLVADLTDATAKYGPRGYRYALIEAGHAAQSLIQVLGAAGIECRPFGGFDDGAVARHLGLADGTVPLYAVGAVPADPGSSGTDWVKAEEIKCVLVNGQSLYYANAYGPKTGAGRECGFGVDTSADGARLRAKGELAERLALVGTRRRLGNSNGMAAHTRREAAADAAMYELYERHCFLRTWLTQRTPPGLHPPDSPLTDTVLSLCRSGGVRLSLLDIADPAYGVPAVMAVVHAEGHGGVITSSGAGADEPEAAARALREIAKALVYRLVLRKTSVFTEENPVTGALSQPWEHEAWFAHRRVPVERTGFLLSGDSRRSLRSGGTGIGTLRSAITVEDLSAEGPDERRWKIARATSERLLLVDFGTASPAFRSRAAEVLGPELDIDARWPHPLG
ncbi:YcaO-like family protein [Streptomyces sp. NBC_00893]|uniref:YcaO-like family protein n=1 Tax=Streptomyces sp. NBC_00893 TaxID=2975862 RepID=UPI002257D8F4|nr:YcaO-like family protein [Streptomyces sp. NBC_00893]MCX4846795.1 YcaO-like family protein [Streptomyces sp. NBC_00893]